MVLLFALGCQAAPHTHKPQGPLTVTITPEGEVVPGEPVTLVVRVSSSMASPDLQLLVHPPGDMQLVSGELQWRGAIARNGTVTLQFTGLFSDKHASTVSATAHVAAPGGGRMASRAQWRTGPQPAQKPAPQGRVIKRNGEDVVEVPLKQ